MTMPRDEALALAMDVLDDVDKGTSDRGRSPDRLAEVLDVARFLAEAEDDGEEVEEEADEEEAAPEPAPEGRLILRDAMPAGPALRVQCAASPGDFAYARSGRSGTRPFVHVEVQADGDIASVALDVAEARAYAAGILNAADEAEGTSPLLMFRPAGDDEAGPGLVPA